MFNSEPSNALRALSVSIVKASTSFPSRGCRTSARHIQWGSKRCDTQAQEACAEAPFRSLHLRDAYHGHKTHGPTSTQKQVTYKISAILHQRPRFRGYIGCLEALTLARRLPRGLAHRHTHTHTCTRIIRESAHGSRRSQLLTLVLIVLEELSAAAPISHPPPSLLSIAQHLHCRWCQGDQKWLLRGFWCITE